MSALLFEKSGMVGTLTIKANDKNGCLYEGTMKGEDPDGKAFTRTISAVYDPAGELAATHLDCHAQCLTRASPSRRRSTRSSSGSRFRMLVIDRSRWLMLGGLSQASCSTSGSRPLLWLGIAFFRGFADII